MTTWEKQFHSTEMAQKVPLLYLANDILQNSKRQGNEFVDEFWNVLPKAVKDIAVSQGDDRGKGVVSRLVQNTLFLYDLNLCECFFFLFVNEYVTLCDQCGLFANRFMSEHLFLLCKLFFLSMFMFMSHMGCCDD